MPRETLAADEIGDFEPWVQTPFPLPSIQTSLASSSPLGVSFSLQSYLNDENDMEKCLVGAPKEQSSCQHLHTTWPAVQLDKRECLPIAATPTAAPTAANTAPSSPDWLQINCEESCQLPDVSASAADDGTDPNVHEALSLDSWSSRSTASSAVSSTFSSNRSLLNDGCMRLSVSARHAALHHQLEDAGLSGLGDGSSSLELYHRYG